jgi:uncharacterized protein (TIGR02271 family)
MARANENDIKPGNPVVASDNRRVGTVERVAGNAIIVGGMRVPLSEIARVENDTVYLSGAGAGYTRERFALTETGGAAAAARTDATDREGTIRVPEVTERLDVTKREVELGQVEIRKHVEQEQVSVPVDLTRDEVRVEQVDVTDRPLREGELADAFQEGTIRVPVRGEEAVVEKEAVVTGEVVINKERVTERRNIADTVRRLRVDVDEDYLRHRDDLRRHHETTRARQAGGTTRRFEDAEVNYRLGHAAARDERFAGRAFDETEPELRRDYESSEHVRSGGQADPWERIKDEVREGFHRVRR